MWRLEILEPAGLRALTTVAAVREELGDLLDDGHLSTLIMRAGAEVEKASTRSFARERIRETFRFPDPDEVLLLDRWPVTELHSVTVDENEAKQDFYVQDGLLRRTDGRAFGGGRPIAVEYSAGYRLPGEEGRNLPHDIEGAVVALVKLWAYDRGRDPNIRSEGADGLGTITYSSSKAAADALRPVLAYRVPLVG